MSAFLGVLRYEYRMSVSRPLFLLGFGLLILVKTWGIWPALTVKLTWNFPPEGLWQLCGSTVFELNMFMPLLAGILMADRLVRDGRLGVDELLHGTILRNWPYVLGKYCGALLSGLTPAFLTVVLLAGTWLYRGLPVESIGIWVLAFATITLPAYVFVTAFSLACPMVMRLRVYQVLFVGYWFWGNYLTLGLLPTLRGTWLSANGELAHQAFFKGWPEGLPSWLQYTAWDATLNLMVLGLCSLGVLLLLERSLAWQRKQA